MSMNIINIDKHKYTYIYIYICICIYAYTHIWVYLVVCVSSLRGALRGDMDESLFESRKGCQTQSSSGTSQHQRP